VGHSIVDIGGMVSKRGAENSEPAEGLVQRMRKGLHRDVFGWRQLSWNVKHPANELGLAGALNS
jgi:hypothetical protein